MSPHGQLDVFYNNEDVMSSDETLTYFKEIVQPVADVQFTCGNTLVPHTAVLKQALPSQSHIRHMQTAFSRACVQLHICGACRWRCPNNVRVSAAYIIAAALCSAFTL